MNGVQTRSKAATAWRAPAALLLVAFAAVVFLLLAAMLPCFALAQSTPVLDAIAPAQADPGTEVTLSGSGFGDMPGKKSGVEFAWHKAADIVAWSDTEIVAIVPARAEDGYVHVTVDGVDSNGVWFVASNLPLSPSLDSLSTYVGPPGTEVTFYGEGFGPKKQSSFVTFGGVRAQFRSWTETEIVAVVPAGAVTGYAGVTVDGVNSNGLYFIPFDPPVVVSVDKTQALPGESVTITGEGFGRKQDGSVVSFQGTPGTVTSWSDTQIVATVPEGASAGYLGVVRDGVVSNGIFFIPFGMPAVDSLSAEWALVGDTLTLTGQNFGDAPAEVVVDGVAVPHDTWSDTQVTFTVPADAGPGYVGVRRDGVTSNGIYLATGPRLTAISRWWAEEGMQVTVDGVGFGDDPSGHRVTVNGVEVAADSWSPSAVTFTVPAGATSGYVGVWTDWVASNGIYLLIVKQAHISAVDTAAVVPGQEITITGTDFGPAAPESAVMLGGTYTCTVLSWSDTQIVARIPDVVESGYVGVWKSGVASNGVWVEVAP